MYIIYNLQDFITYSQNEVSPELFGAVGDGIYDDTEALQSAIDYCFKNGVQLKLRSGKTYCISKPLNLSNTAVLIIDGSWSTLKAKKAMNYMLTYDGSANTKNDVKTKLSDKIIYITWDVIPVIYDAEKKTILNVQRLIY